MDQRTQFSADHLRDILSITELCALYGISRKTGYKWIDRYLRHGPAGLEEDSRRPRRSPNQTSEEVVSAILDARRRHPRWGGKKLLALLHNRQPPWTLPGRSAAPRWHAWRDSRRGGSAWASCRSSSSPGTRSRTADTNGCIGP